jgi:hypothetical protein
MMSRARSDRHLSPSAGDARPTRRSRRRPLDRRRIRARQAPTVHPPAVPETVMPSPPLGSHGRRRVYTPDAPWSADPVRYRLQTLNPLALSSGADDAEVSPALFVEGAQEAGPERTQPGRGRGRRRDEAAASDLGLPTDCSAGHLGVRHSYQQGRGAAYSRRAVPRHLFQYVTTFLGTLRTSIEPQM